MELIKNAHTLKVGDKVFRILDGENVELLKFAGKVDYFSHQIYVFVTNNGHFDVKAMLYMDIENEYTKYDFDEEVIIERKKYYEKCAELLGKYIEEFEKDKEKDKLE